MYHFTQAAKGVPESRQIAIGGTGAIGRPSFIVQELSVRARKAGRRREDLMKLSRRKLLHLAAGAAVLPAFSGVARAQAYPTRPITLVAPFPPGGPVDTIARILAEHMRGSLGQPLLVENIAGAAGSLGVGRVARAAPDGYTLIVGQWSTHVANAAIYKLQYDTLADFAPIALLSNNPGLIVGRKNLPANDLKELVAWLKANPETATQGTPGAGGFGHIGGVFFQNVTGTKYQFVPYRGAAPMIQDLLAGQFDIAIDTPTTSIPQIRGGAIKGFAVMSKTRLAAVPDLPTADEAGVPGLYLLQWNAVWAPKGTPGDIVTRLNQAIVRAMADPAVRQRLADLGQEIYPPELQTPEALAEFQKTELHKWGPIITAANIKVE
jgi:tripartite-type tricarboxylate transporter receptor subunit TctC